MKTLLLGIAILLSISTHAYADISADKKAQIQELFEVMGLDEQINGGFEAMLGVVDQMSARMQLNAQQKNQLTNIYRDWFKYDIDHAAMQEKFVQLYADAFTSDEVDKLVAFYKTPTGQKFLEKSPGLMKRGAQIGMQEAKSKEDELMQRLQLFLESVK